jgi:hypothetical protein
MRDAKERQYLLYDSLRNEAQEDLAAVELDPIRWTEYVAVRQHDIEQQLGAVESEEKKLRQEIADLAASSHPRKAELLGLLEGQADAARKLINTLLLQRREFERATQSGSSADQTRSGVIQALREQATTFGRLADRTQALRATLQDYYSSLESIVQDRMDEIKKQQTQTTPSQAGRPPVVAVLPQQGALGSLSASALAGVWHKYTQPGSRDCPRRVEIDIITATTGEGTQLDGRFRAWFSEPIDPSQPSLQFSFAGPTRDNRGGYTWEGKGWTSGTLHLELVKGDRLAIECTGQPAGGAVTAWRMCPMLLERRPDTVARPASAPSSTSTKQPDRSAKSREDRNN